MKKLLIAVALAFSVTPALADDSHGDSGEVVSIPADDAVLSEAPRELSLTFEHPVILQRVVVHGPGHVDIPANFTASAASAANYTIPLPQLATGAYEVHWNATGEGHDMEGTLHFTIR